MRGKFLEKAKPDKGRKINLSNRMCLTLGVTAGCLFLAPKSGLDQQGRRVSQHDNSNEDS